MRGSRKAYHARQVFLLVFAILLLAAQAGDGALDPVSVKAMICQQSGRDNCGNRRARIILEPATVRVEVYMAQHRENLAVTYGLICAGEGAIREQSGPYSLDVTPAMMFAEYQRQGAGECYGFAVLERRGVEPLVDRDGPLLIQSRQ